jgi:hypothetical protein
MLIAGIAVACAIGCGGDEYEKQFDRSLKQLKATGQSIPRSGVMPQQEQPAQAGNQPVAPAAKNTPAAGGGDAISQQEVTDIIGALNAKDVEKVKQILAAKPQMIKAKETNGGPVSGWPLLMIAAAAGDKPMVEMLLDSGADVNDKNLSNETPLIHAAFNGHKEVVELLLAKGADVNVKNHAEATALSAAMSGNHPDVADLLRQHGAQ